MAKNKPKKTEKKAPVEAVKAEKTEKVENKIVSTPKSACETAPFKGFFAKKYDINENVMTIFKSPRIWGALLGEVLGTMLITMLFLTLGITNPLYIILAVGCVYIVIAGISGAQLNPAVTAGMMATRRMSAIRGVLYMLAQVLGAWIGLIIVNAFRLGSGTSADLPMMLSVEGETFWAVALVELLGTAVIAFVFARVVKFIRKSPMTFAFAVTSAMTLAVIFGVVISQSFFAMQGSSFMFNPATALMYQILPTAADGIGELLASAGLALAAYIVFPVIGGVLGFFLADTATRLSGCDECCCDKK